MHNLLFVCILKIPVVFEGRFEMSSPIAGMCCVNCLYFDQTDEHFGDCRRHAPSPNPCSFVTKMESVGKIHIDIHWPKVFNSNWCGQFGARKKVQKKPQEAPRKIVVQRPVHEKGEAELQLTPVKPAPKVMKVPPVVIIE
jgi:hypothetical protein